VQLVVEKREPGDENAVAEHLIAGGIDGIIPRRRLRPAW
jgi:hypothetical protein